MRHQPTSTRLLLTAAAAIAGALATIHCSNSNNTPTTPTTPTVAVASVALNPSSVTAGGTSQGTVTLSAAAPAGGSAVSLASSNTGVATVPSSVTVAAGSTSAGFTVNAVAAGTSTITATLNGSQTATVTVVAAGGPVTLLGISLNVTTVVGGNSVTGAATLTGPAPSGGAVVTLSGNDPATVPPNVTVPAGQTSATFTITTRAVGGTIPVTISGTYAGVTASAALSVTPIVPPASLASITLNPASVNGGTSSQGTATLDNAAPSGGAVVALSSSAPLVATLPVSVTIPEGSTSGTFNIATSPVSSQTMVTISGNYVATRTATLTVNNSLPVARFVVTSQAGNDTCKLFNNGSSFDCVFDASGSTALGTIVAYDWTYAVSNTINQTATAPIFNPSPNCGLLPSPLPNPKPASLQMTVSLRVRDNLGNASSTTTNSNVKILPTGQACGF